MASGKRAQMEKICRKCGDNGCVEKLMTCYQCNRASEHIYCMREKLAEVPTQGYCEACAEAIHKDTSKRMKTIGGKCYELDNIRNLDEQVLQYKYSRRERLLQKSAPLENSKIYIPMGNFCNRSEKTTQKNEDSEIPPHMESGFIKTENSLPSLLVFNQCGKLQSHFATQPSWKGKFEVFDGPWNVRMYSSIQVHFPHIVRPKAYDALKLLPEKLSLQLLPQSYVWPKIYQSDSPTKDDVGLYFLPCEVGRHRENYHQFLERLSSYKLAMITRVAGIHLLIFTSKQLPIDSQRINGKPYLWGVFGKVKYKKLNWQTRIRPLCSADVGSDGDKQNLRFETRAEKVDMEIDDVVPIQTLAVESPVTVFPLKQSSKPIHTCKPPKFPTTSAHKINSLTTTSKMVTSAIYPDLPPGFPAAKHQCKSLDATFHEVATAIHSDTPHGSPIRSLTATSTSVEIPIHPDAPPGFPKLPTSNHQRNSPDATSNKVARPIHSTVPLRFPIPATPQCRSSSPMTTSKKVEIPIHPDAPPGFPTISRSKHQSNSSDVTIHLDVPPGFPKLSPSKGRSNSPELISMNDKTHVSTIPGTKFKQTGFDKLETAIVIKQEEECKDITCYEVKPEQKIGPNGKVQTVQTESKLKFSDKEV